MQVWDLLGLYFACQDPVADHIEPVPTAYGEPRAGRNPAVAHATGCAHRRLGSLPLRLPALSRADERQRLSQRAYATRADFIQAYFRAPTVLLEFRLV